MILQQYRIQHESDFTVGYLKVNGQFEAYTLEDEKRVVKVDRETRIPSGKYAIKFREVLSPMTERYRDKFDWFTWHLMLEDVPGFEYVYIHIGNTDDHTDGCILVGSSINTEGFLGTSTAAFKNLYKQIAAALDRGEEVTLYIHE